MAQKLENGCNWVNSVVRGGSSHWLLQGHSTSLIGLCPAKSRAGASKIAKSIMSVLLINREFSRLTCLRFPFNNLNIRTVAFSQTQSVLPSLLALGFYFNLGLLDLSFILAREKSRPFATSPLVSSRNDVWGTSIQYWWRYYLGSASHWLKQISHAARPIRSTIQIWHVTSMEFLRSYLRRHFAGKPVVPSRNVGWLLRLCMFEKHNGL